MAQEYSAELGLQDRFTNVLERALRATEQFRQEINNAQRSVTELGNSRVNIPVRANIATSGFSSFSAVQTEINRLNQQRINISAGMNPNITTELEANMTRIGESLSRSLNSAITSAFNRASGGLNNFNESGNNGSGISNTTALTGAIAALAASIAGMNRNPIINNHQNPTPRPTPPTPSIPPTPEPTRPSWWDRLFPNNNDYDAHNVSYSNGQRTVQDPRYASLIERQQQAYQNAHGTSYLSGRTVNHDYLQTGPEQEEFLGPASVTRNVTRFEAAMLRMRESATNTVNAIRTRFSTIFTSIRAVPTTIFNAVRTQFESVRDRIMASPIGMNIVFTGERALYNVLNIFPRMREAIGGVIDRFRSLADATAHPLTARLIDNASRVLTGIRSTLMSVASRAWNITVRVATSAAKASIKAIKSGLEELKGLCKMTLMIGTGAALLGAKEALKGGSDMEQNEISMKHFIGLNQKNPTLAQADTNAYMDYLNKYANKTPFGNNEIMDAGRRALTSSQGNIVQSKAMVNLAGDMAALNPGKSVMDSMEALADAKNGEFERLKEFGYKISAEEFKGFVGKGKNDTLTDAETNTAYNKLISTKLAPTFNGGAEKLSASGAGKFSTLTGNIGYYAALAGRGALDQLKGPMDKINDWFDKNDSTIKKWASNFGAGFSKVLSDISKFASGLKEGFAPFSGPIGAKIKEISDNFGKLFKGGASEGIKKIGQVVGDIFGRIVLVGATVVNFFVQHWPEISSVFNTVKDAIMKVFDWIEPRALKIYNWIEERMPQIKKIISDAWDGVCSVFKTVWEFISPILDMLGSAIKVIADIFILVWPAIKGTITTLWEVAKIPLGLLKDALDAIAKAVQWVCDKFDLLAGKKLKVPDIPTAGAIPTTITDGKLVKETAKAEEAPSGANTKSVLFVGKKDHAVGLDRVPWDNYLANLHQGEMVLTRGEADNYRSLMNGSGKSGNSTGMQGVVDSINKSQSDIATAVNKTIKLITDPFDTLKNNMPTTAQDMLKKFIDGINSTTSNVTNAVKTLTDKVIEEFKTGFGIHSPSVVMHSIGGHLLQGLINGMSSKDLKGFVNKQIGDITSAFSGSSGAVSGSVTEWLTKALMSTGTSLDWLPGLQKLVMAESSGNPFEVNSTPVGNEHATGLLQTLPSTFREFASKGMGDIMNPIDNAAAAINYIKSRYGSVYNTPLFKGGSYAGYAIGLDRVPYDNMPAMLHQDETVLTRNEADLYRKSKMQPSQSKQNISTSNVENHNQIDIHIDGAQDTKSIVKELVTELKNVLKNTSGGNAAFV